MKLSKIVFFFLLCFNTWCGFYILIDSKFGVKSDQIFVLVLFFRTITTHFVLFLLNHEKLKSNKKSFLLRVCVVLGDRFVHNCYNQNRDRKLKLKLFRKHLFHFFDFSSLGPHPSYPAPTFLSRSWLCSITTWIWLKFYNHAVVDRGIFSQSFTDETIKTLLFSDAILLLLLF